MPSASFPFQPRPARSGDLQVRGLNALLGQPAGKLGNARQDRGRAERPAPDPADQEAAGRRDHHRERRQRPDGEPAEQQRRTHTGHQRCQCDVGLGHPEATFPG